MEINYIEQFGNDIYRQMTDLGFLKFSRFDLTIHDLQEKLKVPDDIIMKLANDRKFFISGPWYIFKHNIKGKQGFGMGYDPDLDEEFNILEEDL
jgi:hypothetical protein